MEPVMTKDEGLEIFKTMNSTQQRYVLQLQRESIEHSYRALAHAKAQNTLMGIVLNFLDAVAATRIPLFLWPKCVREFHQSVYTWNIS